MQQQTDSNTPSPPDSRTTEDQGDDEQPNTQGLTFFQMLGSTLAAAVGVQSSKNRKRDFTQGRALHFMFMGIGFTAVFVLIRVGLVNLVLSSAS